MSRRNSNRRATSPYEYSNPSLPAQQARPTPNGLPQSTLPPGHTLPSLLTQNYVSADGNQVYAPRISSHLMPSHSEPVSQTNPFPVYAPTANTYYTQQYGTNAAHNQSFQHQPPVQSSMPSSIPLQTHPPMQPAHTATTRNLPDIAPMPPRIDTHQLSAFANNGSISQSEEIPQPSHVVGSQGRRGILPSAAGRPSAIIGADVNGQKAPATPSKDADGKFPCPHCDKTYLHAKHLKRHLLRHTGVRPYGCGLCSDTFSRSDILKRHFAKCSDRRGNPTGQNHLAHSRANKKARERQEAENMESSTPTGSDHGQLSTGAAAQVEPAFDFNNLNLNQASYGDASNQVSRANSVKESNRSVGTRSNRASLGMVNTSGYESNGYGNSTGHITPESVTTSGAATPYTYHPEPRISQISENGAFAHIGNGTLSYSAQNRPPTSSSYNHGSLPRIVGQDTTRDFNNMEWPQVLQYQSHDEYGNGNHHSGTNTPLDREKDNPDFSNISFPQYVYPNQKA